jgi:putative endonuclease
MAAFFVYILANKPRGTLYIGMTGDMPRRTTEHRRGRGSGFTRKYLIKMLVWSERYDTEELAHQRERTMKEWPRAWKINLIERTNPHWVDLSSNLPGEGPREPER